MVEENKAVVRAWFEETDRKKSLPIDLCAPEFAAHYPGNPTLNAEVFKPHLESFYRAFPDMTQQIEQLLAEEDLVGFRVTTHGTHTGDFNGVPPTGERIAVSQIGIARVADGKVAEIWNNPDRLGLMHQLGIVPPPQSAPQESAVGE
jgi:predicted ester cyclase